MQNYKGLRLRERRVFMKLGFMKKTLCLLIVLVMVFSLLPLSASAATLTKGYFEYTVTDGQATITAYTGNEKNVTVPATLGGYPVCNVATGTFYQNNTVESIIFSEGIRSISTYGDTAIFGCTALKTISLPASLQVEAPGLSNGVITGMFALCIECPNVQKINVASKNPYITAVDGVVFNKNKTSILRYPSGKTDSRYVVPETVNYVADSAFEYQQYLQEVVLPDKVEYIGYWAFNNADKLEKINIPEKCELIGQFAFQSTEIRSVHIPENCMIMQCTFTGTPIEKITLDKNSVIYQLIDGVLYRICEDTGDLTLALYPVADPRETYVMPDRVTSMFGSVLHGAENLTRITLGKNLEEISNSAFFDCRNLNQIIIPKSVKRIGNHAFANNYELGEVYYAGTKSQWNNIEIEERAFTFFDPVVHCGITSPANHSKVINTNDFNDSLIYTQYACSCSNSGYTKCAQPVVSSGNVATHLGETVTIAMCVQSEGLRYKWYYKDKGASKFRLTESFVGNSYSIEMNESRDGRQVYCVVTDINGNSVQTKTVTLTARKAPRITVQPADICVAKGEIAKVKVSATGDGLTYTWYIKNASGTKFSKSSVTGSTYSVTMSDSSNGRQVYCVVTDKFGNSVKSDVATLKMAVPVKITTQPKTTYTKLGATAKVTVKASGDGLTYTWYIRNANASTYSKSSITSATYSVKMSGSVKDRRVYCIVKDQYGNTVQTKTVILRMAASITSQPVNASAAKGKTVSVTVGAAGDGLTYKWYIKNASGTKFSVSSVTGATYSCTMSATSNGRQIYCVVTDKYGNTVKSNVVTLSMK